MNVKRLAAGTLILGVLAGIGLRPISPTWAQDEEPTSEEAPAKSEGLLFHLSPGSPEMDSDGKLPKTPKIPLSAEALQRLLQRVPAIKAEKSDRQTFALRESSKPAPRTAKTIDVPFPPHEQREKPASVSVQQPLQITGAAPKGDIEMAPHMSVTFNQPMVPVTTVEQLAEKDVPVKLTPQPAGKWRWLGTQTLMFVPDIRFPMSSNFHVEIPAGITSANGQSLAKAESFDFETPTVVLDSYTPSSGAQKLNPVIFMHFNQDIDPAAVLATVKLASGTQPVTIRQATAAEIAADPNTRHLVDGPGKKRWLAVVPAQPLTPSTAYTVNVGPGTPSLEGPRKTTSAQSFSFSTYDALTLQSHTEDAQPLSQWYFGFNNPIDVKLFKPEMVTVTPELPGFKVKPSGGGSLQITGRSKGRTNYKVTISAALTDTFGQKLGHAETVEIKVGSAEPSFAGPSSAFTVLDPVGAREVTCSVINYPKLKVTAYRMKPSDWPAYLKYLQEHSRNLKDQKIPGEKVIDTQIDTHAKPDELTEVKVDLSSAFQNNLGQVMLVVEPLPHRKEDYYRPMYVGWVQSTRIGLDAMADHDNLLGWASDLTTGKPLEGVQFSLASSTGKSDANGLATLPLTNSMAQLLIARKGDDVAILPRDFSYWNTNGWTKIASSEPTLWYVIDDRKLYRPGEKISLKGWMRKEAYGPLKDIEPSKATSVAYKLYDSRGNEVLKGEAKVGRLGGFNLQVDLPKNINLGSTRLNLVANTGESSTHSFQIEEFRRPEFEVSASASPASTVVGEHSSVTASAAYFAGGPLANAQVDWAVTSTPTTYSPPNWSEYTFGTWTPWWNYRSWWSSGVTHDRTHRETQQTRSDSKGQSTLRMDFQSVDPPQPQSVSAQATVQDVNRQSWSTSTSLLVHPASMYIGLKSQRTFVEKGQPIELSAVVTSIEGKPVAGKSIEVKAYRLDWEDSEGEYKVKHADETSQMVVSGAQPVPVKIATGQGGTYQIDCYISDENNRRNHSQMTVWVAGGKVPPSRNVEQEAITLVPSKKEYEPNDTAEVLVQAPFAPAELVVTTRRNGLAKVQHVSAPSGSTTLKFPLNDVYVPGVTVQVDAVGSKTRTDADGKNLPGSPQRPAYGTGTLLLPISNKSRRLTVDVVPDAKSLIPGADTGVTLKLKDSAGKPVSGEVSLMMVDEAVLAMTGYDPADPLSSFCFVRAGDVSDAHLRQYVLLSKIEIPQPPTPPPAPMMSAGMPRPMAAPGGGAYARRSMMRAKAAPVMDEMAAAPAPEPQQQIRVRSNFNPLAAFAPAVTTDAAGQAHVHIKLPDNLTRYRLVAVAAAGTKQFGKGESSVVARQPLMVRPSAPRFLNFGDHFEMPVVVQNQTDQPMNVELACKATNAVVGEGGARGGDATGKSTAAGYTVRVPANDRVEVRIPCAADSAGTARFQFAVSSGAAADAAEISLPVWTPATTEAFATYGVIDAGAITQPIEKPKNVFEQFGGLTVTTSSTALSELTDAFLYLQSYPFECSEQISSRMLAAAALKDVLEAFKAPGMPDKETLDAAMARDLQRLKGQQNSDGGFDYWVREKPSIPYLSVHVAHTLVRVKSKGFAVDENMLGRSLEFARTIESHIPAEYPEYCKRSIRAYALYVLNLAGKPDPAKARALAANLKDLPVEALGWLLPTLAKDPASKSIVDEINRYLDNHITQTASTAQFNTGYSDNDYLILHSNRCDDGIILESLISTRPDSPIIPKLVRGLLDHRVAGRWANTQENCWVLLGLDRYFQEYEKITPDFVAQMWLGKNFAGEQQFRGRNKDENALQVPMSQVASPLTINKEGKGRLYYRVGMKYAPTDLKLAPADYGFAVSRTYTPIKDNRDVRKDAEGRWHIKAGTEVKVTVTMQASSRRYHVALVDPLPAGLEALNPALLGTGDRAEPAEDHLTAQGRRGWWWSYHWFDHENLRDERVEAFTQLLWEGVYTYSYIARATTPGNFVVPPAKAEEMYHPETFGRSGSDRVIVEEK